MGAGQGPPCVVGRRFQSPGTAFLEDRLLLSRVKPKATVLTRQLSPNESNH
jgi:hypothetical protein